MAVSALPRYMGLRSHYNNNYMRYRNEESETREFIQGNGEDLMSPLAKYEVVPTNTSLVHIRCSYSNKFWRRVSQDQFWIAAVADEPEEDKSKWQCTLFEPVFAEENNPDTEVRFRLRHVQLRHFAALHTEVMEPYYLCLFAGRAAPYTHVDVFIPTDWSSQLILPKHVAFKGADEKYLTVQSHNDRPLLQFADIKRGDPRMWFESSTDGNARTKITSYHNKNYLRLDGSNWVYADHSTNAADNFFSAVKVDNSDGNVDVVAALRSLTNYNYCKRDSSSEISDGLSANSPTILSESRLVVEPLTLQSNISKVAFNLTDARIYSQRVITMDTKIAYNPTLEPKSVEVTFLYTDTKTSAWNILFPTAVSMATNLESGVPFITRDKIVVDTADFTGAYTWGEVYKEETRKETPYTVVVPPRTGLLVNMLASRASCHIPFSYYQKDDLYDGTGFTFDQNDGIYRGTNFFDFKYEIGELPDFDTILV